MDKKKALVIGGMAVLFILIAVFIFVYFIKRDINEEKILRDEIRSLADKDITKDRFNTDIKTSGDYAVVEKVIKKYKDDFAVNYQAVLSMLTDEKIKNMLSASNYKSDGPDFKASKELLATTRVDFNDKVSKLIGMTDEKTIMKQIDKKKLSGYYDNLYKSLMINDSSSTDWKSLKTTLESSSKKMNEKLDFEEKVLDFLIEKKGKWSAENDKIVFSDNDTLNSYNTLISELK